MQVMQINAFEKTNIDIKDTSLQIGKVSLQQRRLLCKAVLRHNLQQYC